MWTCARVHALRGNGEGDVEGRRETFYGGDLRGSSGSAPPSEFPVVVQHARRREEKWSYGSRREKREAGAYVRKGRTASPGSRQCARRL